jgi:hypothetical protein
MRTVTRLFVVFSLAVLASAISKDTPIEELKTRLQSTNSPDERAKLCVAIAERQVANADKLFQAGNSNQAQAAVSDVVTYSGQARDAAGVTGHRAKDTEIAVRKMIHRLSDMKRSLSFEDQGPVQSAIDQMEKIRTDLLNRMFKGTK